MSAINSHRHRSLLCIWWDSICYCLLFLACRVFALSCQYICAIVVILFVLSWVISVQQIMKFLRFRYSSLFLTGSKYLPSARTRRPDQQGRPPGRGPLTPHQQGTPNPKWGKVEHNPQLGRVDVLIHFSQTSSNVMRNWCRPVAQPSPSWRR